jgi:S-formylglutathione hydrolase FrmB
MIDRLIGRWERFRSGRAPGAELAAVRRIDFRSLALGRRATFLAYLPAAEGRPVVYLLHGSTGRWTDWSDHAHRQLRALAERLRLVVVTPEGGRGRLSTDGWYLDGGPGRDYETHLVSEVRGEVERRLPVASVRGIAGLSMGGHGALTLALKHPSLYSSASSMSGVVDLTVARDRSVLQALLGPEPSRWQASSARHLFATHADLARLRPWLITVGASDHWAPANRALHSELERLHIPHTFEETPGGHDWPYWTGQLARHLRWHGERLAT